MQVCPVDFGSLPDPDMGSSGSGGNGGAATGSNGSMEKPPEDAERGEMDDEGVRRQPCPRKPREATQADIDAHWQEEHWPPRSWCFICLAARSISSPHGAGSGSEKLVPIIAMDYCYTGAGKEAEEERYRAIAMRYEAGILRLMTLCRKGRSLLLYCMIPRLVVFIHWQFLRRDLALMQLREYMTSLRNWAISESF